MAGALSLFPYLDVPWQTLLPALKNLRPHHLAWRVERNPSSIGWLIDHMAGAEDFWINQVAFEEPLLVPEEVEEGNLPALIAKHDLVRARTKQRLRSLSVSDLQRPVEVPQFADGWMPHAPPTIGWVLHHVSSHEAYHIGQIVMLLRLQGLPEPLF
jgi:uncharacterized damage-inducible protein DinB